MSETDRARLTAEVLELGEELFELALEGQKHQGKEEANITSDQVGNSEGYPVEELHLAVNEFFTAIRLLLAMKR